MRVLCSFRPGAHRNVDVNKQGASAKGNNGTAPVRFTISEDDEAKPPQIVVDPPTTKL